MQSVRVAGLTSCSSAQIQDYVKPKPLIFLFFVTQVRHCWLSGQQAEIVPDCEGEKPFPKVRSITVAHLNERVGKIVLHYWAFFVCFTQENVLRLVIHSNCCKFKFTSLYLRAEYNLIRFEPWSPELLVNIRN